MVTVEARGPHDDQLQTRDGAKGEGQRAMVPLHVASHQQDLRLPGHHVLLAIFKDQFYRVSSKEVVKLRNGFRDQSHGICQLRGRGGPLCFPIKNCHQPLGQKVILGANKALISFLHEMHQYMVFIAYYTEWKLKNGCG